jgi:hypothetical protein
MKKFIVAVLAAAVATLSLAADTEARGRGHQWHNSGQHQGWNNRGWHGRHAGWNGRHGWRGRHYGWRHNRWNDHGGYYNNYYGGYYGGYAGYYGYDDGYYGNYCFVKKVRRYDANGNVYIKRKRVCR